MGRVKELLIEAEEMLVVLLNDIGMTNDQAIKEINNKLGSMASSHASDILQQWKEEDEEVCPDNEVCHNDAEIEELITILEKGENK